MIAPTEIQRHLFNLGDTVEDVRVVLRAMGIKATFDVDICESRSCYCPIANYLRRCFPEIARQEAKENPHQFPVWSRFVVGAGEFGGHDVVHVMGVTATMPPAVREFILAFDNGLYPEFRPNA